MFPDLCIVYPPTLRASAKALEQLLIVGLRVAPVADGFKHAHLVAVLVSSDADPGWYRETIKALAAQYVVVRMESDTPIPPFLYGIEVIDLETEGNLGGVAVRLRQMSERLTASQTSTTRSTMHTTKVDCGTWGVVRVHHNSDWSGDVILVWNGHPERLSPSTVSFAELRINGMAFLRGEVDDISDKLMAPVLCRAVSTCVGKYIMRAVVEVST